MQGGSVIVWVGKVLRPYPMHCRAILEQFGHVSFEVKPLRSGASSLWTRYIGTPPEFVEHCAQKLLMDFDLEVPSCR